MALIKSMAWLVITGLVSSNVFAQIVIGQTAGLTGDAAATVNEMVAGERAYIDLSNAKGGVHGATIELITLDDKFDPKVSKTNALKLITENHAIALFMSRGTPHTESLLPLLEDYKIALIAPSTGAMLFRQPVNPYIFNVRSSYQCESEKAVALLATMGMSRIALAYVDDSFGEDAANGARNGLKKLKLELSITIKVARDKPDYAKVTQSIINSNAQAVIWIGAGTVVAEGVRILRTAQSHIQVATLSNNASNGFIKLLGENRKGIIVTQAFPSERSTNYAVIKEAALAIKAKGVAALTPAMLEGYVGAKVLVEALKHAGAHPTRASVLNALNEMNSFDLGGLTIRYNTADHVGLNSCDLSIIDDRGKFLR